MTWIARTASHACHGVSAATTATSSPSYRQTGSMRRLSGPVRALYQGISAPVDSCVRMAATPGIFSAAAVSIFVTTADACGQRSVAA